MALPWHIIWWRWQTVKLTGWATSKAGQHAVGNLKLQALHTKNAKRNICYISEYQLSGRLNQSWTCIVSAAETNKAHAVTPAASFVMEY
jgi:hypothetical protein